MVLAEANSHVRVQRRRRAGDTQAGCLFTIILVIAAIFVGYNYFVKDHALKNAGQDVKMLEEDNPDAFNIFRKKMAKEILKDEKATANMIQEFFFKVKAKKLTEKEIHKQADKLKARLAKHIDDINGRAAPKIYFQAHKKNAEGIGHLYRCLLALKQTTSAKTPEEEKALLQTAGKELRQGQGNIDIARGVIRLGE